MTMITKAVVVLNGTPSIDVTGQQLIEGSSEDYPCSAGEDIPALRCELESCFRQLFPEAEVEILFPELGEVD